jgi:hypothetical protein
MACHSCRDNSHNHHKRGDAGATTYDHGTSHISFGSANHELSGRDRHSVAEGRRYRLLCRWQGGWPRATLRHIAAMRNKDWPAKFHRNKKKYPSQEGNSGSHKNIIPVRAGDPLGELSDEPGLAGSSDSARHHRQDMKGT